MTSPRDSCYSPVGIEWNKSNTIRFIKLYEKFSVLWDMGSSEHKNSNTRIDALNEIATKMGCSISEIEKKITTVRSQYFRELAKIKKSVISGNGAEEVYKPSWYAFALLSFLGPSVEPAGNTCARKIITTFKVEQDGDSTFQNTSDDGDDALVDDRPSLYDRNASNDQLKPQKDFQLPQRPATPEPAPRKRKVPRSRRLEEQVDEAYKVMRGVVDKRRDIFDCFGEFIAHSLRNLDDSKLQLWTRHQITNIMQTAEVQKLQESRNLPGQSSCSNSSTPPSYSDSCSPLPYSSFLTQSSHQNPSQYL